MIIHYTFYLSKGTIQFNYLLTEKFILPYWFHASCYTLQLTPIPG